MSIIEKLKQAVAPKEAFKDKVVVHTTDEGTQYIDRSSIYANEAAMQEIKEATEVTRKKESNLPTAHTAYICE
jgi:diketogulonate reductase-like aldo/keto reductase